MHGLWISIVAVTAAAAVSPPPQTDCLIAPVNAPIVVFFRAPDCSWCPGQRGVEFGVGPSTSVRAGAAGIVSFSGVVAGVRYVVVAQTDGFVATYGMLNDADLRLGERVSAGQFVGHASIRLYFGLRRDGVYVDPVPRLGIPTRRPRLVPSNGSRSRPAREGPPTCGVQWKTGATIATEIGGPIRAGTVARVR